MSYKLSIKVTKEILERSKMCGTVTQQNIVGNCAIALAMRDIFPKAHVYGGGDVSFLGASTYPERKDAQLPVKAHVFMNKFDSTAVNERPLMPEIEFEIEVPDDVIEKINIEEIKPLLINHPTLKLQLA